MISLLVTLVFKSKTSGEDEVIFNNALFLLQYFLMIETQMLVNEVESVKRHL
jgi:hypothetical protein